MTNSYRMIEDDRYLDKEGRRILLGLSFEETEQFVRLDAIVTHLISAQNFATPADERRWYELLEKHEAAVAFASSVSNVPQ